MKRKSASTDAFFNWRVLSGISLVLAGACLAFFALNAGTPSSVQSQSANAPVVVLHPVHADISAPVRDYPAWPLNQNARGEAAENPPIHTGVHTDVTDMVVQRFMQPVANIPSPLLNFPGVPFPGVNCNCAPPDTNGAVGATQYVQIVNTGYEVWDKTTGNPIFGPASIQSVWTGFGGVCQSAGFGDPVVLYDQLANRWVITEFAGSSIPTDECIAVSTSNDATGSYARYDFHLGSNFFDYPKLAVWPDAYYMSMNVFNSSGTSYLGPQGFAFDRTKMLVGDPSATVQAAARLSSSFPPMLPANLDGSTLPPSGAPNSFVLFPDTGNYRIYHYHVDFVNPANSTFTFFGQSAAAGFTQICTFSRSCVPQLGESSGNWLDAIGDRLMFRAAYRNFGDHESLVSNFTVNAGGFAGIRWFELRGVTNGPVTTYQDSTYAPDNTWRWMGSIAMDGQGNMALGFSASSSSIYPQVRYTGRLATDPINMMSQGEGHIYDGTGAQSGTGNRWGDYSAMTIDPVDDQTFWYTQEYYDSTSTFNWRTRIASFKVTGGGGGGANLVSAASRLTHGHSTGSFDVPMPLSGTSGVEDRDGGGNYLAVFTFDTAVTSGTATVISGTGAAGTPVFSGDEMQVPLTGVADQQVMTIEVSNVNGGGGTNDVDFGFLKADVDASRTVDRSDLQFIQAHRGETANSSNFRADINLNGRVDNPDKNEVNANRNHHIP
jgi:hypothetical protein